MRGMMLLACAASLLAACGTGTGAAERRPTAGAGEPGQPEARPAGAGQASAEAEPFGPRSEERRRQDSVLRSGPRRPQKVPSDTT